MKKTLLKISLLISSLGSFHVQAQDFFAGAMGPALSQDWTKGWAEFDPQNKAYPSVTNTTELNGEATGIKEITGTVTLDAGQVYLLKGFVVVRSGGKLIVPAGTVIRGEADLNTTVKNYSTLVIDRGGMIEVNGTSTSPVVFTSNKAVGSRKPGDWGGVVLLGKAVNNQNANNQLEGFNNIPSTITTGLGIYGGTDDADNSGSIKYARIEFAGLAFEANREVNSLTMGSIGSGTVIDYVQASFGFDDSFEFFGGTVNASHLISHITTDDDFDMDFGYRGTLQYGIALRHPEYFDPTYDAASGASTSESFEIDNDASGSTNTPKTAPTVSNFTVVGPVPIGSTYASWNPALITINGIANRNAKDGLRRGARLRRNSALTIKNSIFMGYRNFVMIDGNNTLENYGVTTNPVSYSALGQFKNNVIVNTTSAQAANSGKSYNGLSEIANTNVTGSNPPVADTTVNGPKLRALDAWIRAIENANDINPVAYTAGTLLVDPQNYTNPDFRPVAGSPVAVTDVIYKVDLVGVYPNPVSSSESLNIATEATNYSLINATGVTVKYGNDTKINMNGVENGLYILKVGKNSTKVVVQ